MKLLRTPARLFLVGAAVSWVAFISTPAAQAANPLTCEGYPQPRVFVEAQAWWLPTSGKTGGTDHGHGHFGACIPLEQTLTGYVTIDWVAKLHFNPGYIKKIIAEVSNDASSGQGITTIYTGNTSLSCFSDCTFVLPTRYNTALSTLDGRQNLEYRMEIQEPDGKVMRPSVRFPAVLRNGKTVNDKNEPNRLNAYGWYTDALYAFVRLDSGVPSLPVSGVWSFVASFFSESSSVSTTNWFVSVDPSWHADPPHPGLVVYDQNTACVPASMDCDGPRYRTLYLDTTLLANGPHKLFLKADAQHSSGPTLSGVLVVPFTVQNGATSPPPPPPPPAPPPPSAPSVAITSPAAGATLSGSFTLNARASDPDGVNRVEYLVDGVLYAYDASCCDWAEIVSTSGLSAGRHTLVARARDTLGNWSASAPQTFTVA